MPAAPQLPIWLRAESPNQCVLSLHAQPGASKSSLAGTHGEALKIRIQARPVEGAANAALLAFLAARLGVAKSSLELVAGHSARAKRVRIPLAAEAVAQRLTTE